MRQRLAILDQHGLKIGDIQKVIATLSPLPGAVDFIDWLRERFLRHRGNADVVRQDLAAGLRPIAPSRPSQQSSVSGAEKTPKRKLAA